MLPIFLTERTRVLAGFILFPVSGLLYLLTNHVHLSAPTLLPMTWLDTHCPLITETIWIYYSEILLFPTAYLLCRDLRNINLYIYSFGALQLVSNLIFFVWPTTYPRELYPLPSNADAASLAAFVQMRTTDTAANCCPSLHVSGVFMSAFLFLGEQRTKLPYFLAWASAIALSTLTTKQHYAIDVVAGLLLAVAIHALVRRFARV